MDALTRSVMQDFLFEIWEEERKTALLVTHDMDEAIYLADRTVVITAHPGRIREVIDVDLSRPRRYAIRSEPRFIEFRDQVTIIVREETIKGAADPMRPRPANTQKERRTYETEQGHARYASSSWRG